MTQLDVLEQSQAGTRERWCDGCPRCQDPSAAWCSEYHGNSSHPKYAGFHPVCKRCGHCVKRGTHVDKAEDLRD